MPSAQNHKKGKRKGWIQAAVAALNVLPVGFLLLAVNPAQACTAYAAVGAADVEGGGAMIAKTRDLRGTRQKVEYVVPKNGHAYAGLFMPVNGGRLLMGVNEKGFAVMRNEAESVSRETRKAAPRFRTQDGLVGQEYLIQNCASVDEALTKTKVFKKEPAFYILADAQKIAFVEVMPNGKFVKTVKDKGTLAHTNHYLMSEASVHNTEAVESSEVRLKRIHALLDTTPRPLKMSDFAAFALDRNDGPDNSIFRTGSTPDKQSTQAAVVIHIPENGRPVMRILWRPDPAQPSNWKAHTVKVPPEP